MDEVESVESEGSFPSAGYKTTLCQFYVQGTCNKSQETCSFAHGTKDLRTPEGESLNMDSKYKTTLCAKFLSNGNCPFGPKCRYAHGVREVTKREKAPNALFKTSMCKSYVATGFCPNQVSCQFAHGRRELRLKPSNFREMDKRPEKSKNVLGYKTRMCSNYEESEHCEFGENCHFAHGEEELVSKSDDVVVYSDPTYKVAMCRKVMSGEACEFGVRCKFAHYPEELRKPPVYENSTSSSYKTVLCSNYADEGVCEFGDSCTFAHGIRQLRSQDMLSDNVAISPSSFLLKTVMCRNVQISIPCPHGSKCLFAHSEAELRSTIDNENRVRRGSHMPRSTGGKFGSSSYYSNDSRNASSIKVPIINNNNYYNKNTVMCRNIQQNHYCPRGSSCNFAHSPNELKKRLDPSRHPESNPVLKRKSKTTLCQNYVNNGGHCPFKDKCSFAHGRRELESFKRAKN